jgi:3-keto-5-aminohexanoate cleavage enzyme
MEKLIVTVTPTNTKWFKKDNPHLPETPAEIAADVIEAYQEGATIAHIHARDENGKETFDIEYFRRIVERIRSETDIVIQLSTAGSSASYKEKLIPIRELKSDMASLNIKGSEEEIEYNAKFMRDHGIIPIIEAFDMAMIQKANRLIEKGLVAQPAHFELVFDLESDGTKPLLDDIAELTKRVKALYAGSIWSRNRGAHNQCELDAVTMMIGGHIRVGLEDNLFIAPGRHAKNSAEFVRRVKKLAGVFGRELASVAETRKLIHLNHK